MIPEKGWGNTVMKESISLVVTEADLAEGPYKLHLHDELH